MKSKKNCGELKSNSNKEIKNKDRGDLTKIFLDCIMVFYGLLLFYSVTSHCSEVECVCLFSLFTTINMNLEMSNNPVQ